MTSPDRDRLEDNLRSTLRASHTSDGVDPQEFLLDVRRGARARRTRRVVGGSVAAVLLIAGAGVAASSLDLFDAAADQHVADPTRSGSETMATGSTAPMVSTEASSSGPTGKTMGRRQVPVKIVSGGPIAASEIRPMSLTATGNAAQWVLGATPAEDCDFDSCATLFGTSDAGGRWTTLGQLPLRAADSSEADAVSQVRFAGPERGEYNGWAFGNALLSTHDSGRSWLRPDLPVPGDVAQVEAWGKFVYATVVHDDSTTILRSDVSTDDWVSVDVKMDLGVVSSLAISRDRVAFINTTPHQAELVVSSDSATWSPMTACGPGEAPKQVSTADSSLWVLCGDGDQSFLSVSVKPGSPFVPVKGSFADTARLAAKSPSEALVADSDGIQAVVASGESSQVEAPDFVGTSYFAFTNPEHGYLITDGPTIFRTEDGGLTWQDYPVVGN